MKLIHTTLLKNLKSILKYGILASYSRQKRAATWFHKTSMKGWGVNHVAMRHDGWDQDIVHIEVNIPKSRLRKHSDGLYYVMGDVLPSDFVRVTMSRRVEEEVSI